MVSFILIVTYSLLTWQLCRPFYPDRHLVSFAIAVSWPILTCHPHSPFYTDSHLVPFTLINTWFFLLWLSVELFCLDIKLICFDKPAYILMHTETFQKHTSRIKADADVVISLASVKPALNYDGLWGAMWQINTITMSCFISNQFEATVWGTGIGFIDHLTFLFTFLSRDSFMVICYWVQRPTPIREYDHPFTTIWMAVRMCWCCLTLITKNPLTLVNSKLAL